MSILSNMLLRQIQKASKPQTPQTRLATVSSVNGSDVFLQFYGEDSPSAKPYKRLDSYASPTLGDTVMVSIINGSYVITGKVV